MINPQKIRFIKLGEKGRWETSCLQEKTLRLGYESPHYADELAGNWKAVRSFWLAERRGDEGAATRDVNQIRDFYELNEDDVWITFHTGRLYWCRASKDVVKLGDGSRIRRTVQGWSSTDVNGRQLRVENIDGRVTKVQGYRGTICSLETLEVQKYLVRKINGLGVSEVERARRSLHVLQARIQHLIKGLWWHDFELLIDLVLAKSGWQRFSVMGKTQKDIDLDLYSPTTRKRAFVQIKSSTNKEELLDYVRKFQSYPDFDEMYFIYHTSHSDLSVIAVGPHIHVWGLDQISSLVIGAGLVEWLINKRS